MIFGGRRSAAALTVVVLFAAIAVWAAPPAAAATCVTVPGSTIGTDISIAGQKARIPAISGITLCAGTGTVPIVSVQTSGGTCTFSCLSVLVGGGSVDAEGLTISYREDGVLKTVPVDPPPVAGPSSTCVFSVGSPDAPYPDCFIAIGPELGDPIGDLLPVIDDAVERAEDVEDAACSEIPEARYTVAFCDAPAEWIVAAAGGASDLACDVIPPMTFAPGGEGHEFCDGPDIWVLAAVNNVYCQVVCEGAIRYTVCSSLSNAGVEPGPPLCGY